jgi:hypothetical protein
VFENCSVKNPTSKRPFKANMTHAESLDYSKCLPSDLFFNEV